MTIKVVTKAIRHTATATNTVISMFSEALAGGVRLDGEMTTAGTVEIGLSEGLGETVGGLSVSVNNNTIDKLILLSKVIHKCTFNIAECEYLFVALSCTVVS